MKTKIIHMYEGHFDVDIWEVKDKVYIQLWAFGSPMSPSIEWKDFILRVDFILRSAIKNFEGNY